MSGIWGFLFEVLILGLLGVLAVVLGFFWGLNFFWGFEFWGFCGNLGIFVFCGGIFVFWAEFGGILFLEWGL